MQGKQWSRPPISGKADHGGCSTRHSLRVTTAGYWSQIRNRKSRRQYPRARPCPSCVEAEEEEVCLGHDMSNTLTRSRSLHISASPTSASNLWRDNPGIRWSYFLLTSRSLSQLEIQSSENETPTSEGMEVRKKSINKGQTKRRTKAKRIAE